MLLPTQTSPLDEVWVSLDLETTGLSFDSDEIIEVGAVKFKGDETIDTFHSLVNPYRDLDSFVRRYTGITQEEVGRAPPFSTVAPQLVRLIGAVPIVGHNIAFDDGFLASKGLRLSNPRCDTWDLAFVLLPESREYSLAKVAARLGIAHPQPHRALEDALVTRSLFLRLAEMAEEIDLLTLAEMERLASRSSWVLSYFLRSLEKSKLMAGLRPLQQPAKPSSVGVMGFDTQKVKERLQHPKPLRPRKLTKEVSLDQVASMFENGGSLAKAMPGFEERPEQIAMALAVAGAINDGKRLTVEAGTGVGKSLAYLLPAALYAMLNETRVVVSTNTINLQEQLLTKDVPALVEALAGVEGISVEDFRFTQLKGRANYLCLTRWSHLRSSESLSDDEARLLSKVLVWLGSTATGDRSELNLGGRSSRAPWDRISAQGAAECFGVNGVCFLRAVREKAAGAHLVIVNHALLMSDLVAGRALIPDYDVLIVDEAQHLEEEATEHLGFELSQRSVDDHLLSLGGDRGLLGRAAAALRASPAAETRRVTAEEAAGRMAALLPSVRDSVVVPFGMLSGLLDEMAGPTSAMPQESRVTAATRRQPAWSELEIQWENADVSLSQLHGELAALSAALDGLDEAEVAGYEGLILETVNALQRNAELRDRLAEFVPHPKPDGIYWMSRGPSSGDLVLHAAPLHVGDQLDKLLFAQKESIVLTSATLSTDGNFDHLRERTGFKDTEELLLGSPFDYPRAAMLCVPDDMPEPASRDYQASIGRAVTDAAVAAGGRTMALFTSHASLRATAAAVRGNLQAQGLDLLAQGIDGPPYQLVRSFLENPRSVLLGTASFWEGVDLAGEALKVLLVARLPFSVPSEPVFEARSELHEDSFNEYALPQAILRLRQGFGRLIRTRTDKGVVVILDRRIVSKRYGQKFLRSLPPVTFKTCTLRSLAEEVRAWTRA